MQEISIHGLFITYPTVATDDLYQKITQKLKACIIKLLE